VKRFARLWPTLLVCGLITYVAVTLFGPSELKVSLPEALISMTLIPPQHVARGIGAEGWSWLDGAYWSLWVELRFYVVIGMAFYIARKYWLQAWLVFEGLGWLVAIALLNTHSTGLELLDGALFSHHTPYFTLGILACRYKKGQSTSLDWFALAYAMIHALFIIGSGSSENVVSLSLIIGYTIVFVMFAIFVWRPNVLSWLEHKIVLRIGRASYSFYLLHQVLGISLMTLIAAQFGARASLIAVPFMVGGLLLLSSQIFERIEQPANRWIVSKYKNRKQGVAKEV